MIREHPFSWNDTMCKIWPWTTQVNCQRTAMKCTRCIVQSTKTPADGWLLPPPRRPALGLSKSSARALRHWTHVHFQTSRSISAQLLAAGMASRQLWLRAGPRTAVQKRCGHGRAWGYWDTSATLDGLPGLTIHIITPIYNFISIYSSLCHSTWTGRLPRERNLETILTNYFIENLWALLPKMV